MIAVALRADVSVGPGLGAEDCAATGLVDAVALSPPRDHDDVAGVLALDVEPRDVGQRPPLVDRAPLARGVDGRDTRAPAPQLGNSTSTDFPARAARRATAVSM